MGLVSGTPLPDAPYIEIEGHATLVTKPSSKKRGIYKAHGDLSNCAELVRGLNRFVSETGNVQLIVAEIPHAGAQGARANRLMGIATGIVATWVAMREYAVMWIMPEESKKLFCGKRNAGKLDIQAKVRFKHPGVDWPEREAEFEHQADAVAAVYAAGSDSMWRAWSQQVENNR